MKLNERNELLSLMNVGHSTMQDFRLLGIKSIRQLADASPDELFSRLENITGKRQDPCVWDVFAATVHEAKSGNKTPWWEWTKVRKRRQQQGDFCL